jgi:hypothetical protein
MPGITPVVAYLDDGNFDAAKADDLAKTTYLFTGL